MKSAIIFLFIPIILGMIIPVNVNGSSENEINCYEKGFTDGEDTHLIKIRMKAINKVDNNGN